MRSIAAGMMAGVLAVSCVGARAAPVPGGPIVLELFTSQGCSSCPPADALLGALKAARGDILPLSLHVDYWNRIGWHDEFSSAEITARQYEYARYLEQGSVYTPEMVVDGGRGMVGSDADAVDEAIRKARARRERAPVVDLSISRDGGQIRVEVGAGAGRARVLLLGYDNRRVTNVGRGENAGRTLVETNVVRSMARVADWSGASLVARAPAGTGERQVVLLQASDGRIMAAAAL